MKQTFEEFLNEHVIGMDEINGVSITKDNIEDMFTIWAEGNIQEIIDLAEVWHDLQIRADEKVKLNVEI